MNLLNDISVITFEWMKYQFNPNQRLCDCLNEYINWSSVMIKNSIGQPSCQLWWHSHLRHVTLQIASPITFSSGLICLWFSLICFTCFGAFTCFSTNQTVQALKWKLTTGAWNVCTEWCHYKKLNPYRKKLGIFLRLIGSGCQDVIKSNVIQWLLFNVTWMIPILMQWKCKSIANEIELHLFCLKASIEVCDFVCVSSVS